MLNLDKKIGAMLVLFVTMAVTVGCTSGIEGMNKGEDIEFTVVSDKEIPQTLKEVIEEKKSNPFQITYTNGDELYIAVGYGKQETAGYCITVNSLYETEDAIVIDTTLIGPDQEETQSPSYPYIVVKTQVITDKTVEFK